MKELTITPASIPQPRPLANAAEYTRASQAFGDILSSTIQQVNSAELRGDDAITRLHTGKAENLHEVMLAVEEADMAVRMLVQMRNKALEAYNEIMRLQI